MAEGLTSAAGANKDRLAVVFAGTGAFTSLEVVGGLFANSLALLADAGLGSRAMAADAFQTQACWWLSLIVLVGVGLNALLGWWWADPVAAIAMTYFLLTEALEA